MPRELLLHHFQLVEYFQVSSHLDLGDPQPLSSMYVHLLYWSRSTNFSQFSPVPSLIGRSMVFKIRVTISLLEGCSGAISDQDAPRDESAPCTSTKTSGTWIYECRWLNAPKEARQGAVSRGKILVQFGSLVRKPTDFSTSRQARPSSSTRRSRLCLHFLLPRVCCSCPPVLFACSWMPGADRRFADCLTLGRLLPCEDWPL